MSTKLIIACIRPERLPAVEAALRAANVNGLSAAHVKGYGEYADLYARDWLTDSVRIEVFADDAEAEGIVNAIIDAAHTGLSGDGVVAVVPVEGLYDIRQGRRG